jgi:DNA-binding transcriptional ArsR family regulator
LAAGWTFLTTHARALLCISRDPGIRLRDIADRLGITERSAYAIVIDLAEAGYIVKEKEGRRNRYQIRADLPLPEFGSRERTVGEVLALLASGETERPEGRGERAGRSRETSAWSGAARRADE